MPKTLNTTDEDRKQRSNTSTNLGVAHTELLEAVREDVTVLLVSAEANRRQAHV